MSNALAGSRSPFLQHGAKQPVAWLPWGEDAFARARREDRPVLLDIGAVWCHWCHVMDRESYEDPETAALINELFVPVKVDRDERPDVDTRYQRAVQTLTGQGGWPLTAFLTPDGETFYGGTYFPPADGYGRPSFKRVLREVARIWKDERERALDAVRGIAERLASFAQAEAQPGKPAAALVSDTIEEYAQTFDFRYGGFGRAPKFPNAGALMLLLDHDLETDSGWSGRMVRETMTAMARGGIYDQLGGGFHRYSVDARWIIPHFEKMAYDNGPLLEAYARAAGAYDSAAYRDVCASIIAYYRDVAGDLLERGGFPASQDADYSPDDDGDYWTWTEEEIAGALTEPAAAERAIRFFGVNDPAGSMHLDPLRHVLFQALDQPPPDLAELKKRLKAVRDQRPAPYVDRTVYTGWSALVASGFVAASRYAGQAAAAGFALRALDRIWAESFDHERGLAHRVGDREAVEHLDDHAHFAQALVDAFEVTQDTEWLTRARELVDTTTRLFADPKTGAYRDRPGHAGAITRPLGEPSFSIADSPVPAGNAVLALTLLRLADLLADDALRASARSILDAFGAAAPRLSTAAPTYVRAVDWLLQPTTRVVIIDGEGSELFAAALRTYRPRTTIRRLDPAAAATIPLAPEIRAMVSGEAARAYVCVGQTCFAPIDDPAELRQVLTTRARR